MTPSEQLPIYALRIVAWVTLLGGIVLDMYLYLNNPAVSIAAGVASVGAGNLANTIVLILILLVFFVALASWAVLLALATITESLLEIRENTYPVEP